MIQQLSNRRKAWGNMMKAFCYISIAVVTALTLFMILYIFYKGIPEITWSLVSTSPSYLRHTIGILPDIMNTIYVVIATLVMVLPIGVGAAIYLTEYAKNRKVVELIEFAAETLSGTQCECPFPVALRNSLECFLRCSEDCRQVHDHKGH